jgi:hypothetical protein
MSNSADLERGYRRVLACYPKAFRQENEEEILGVLMDTAEEGQQRIGLAEAAALVRGGLRMRLRPGPSRPPRTVLAAVRLMCIGAVVELAALATVVATMGSLRAAVLARDPAQWHNALVMLTAKEVFAPIGIAVWLWLAWANGRGHDWARLIFTWFFGLLTVSLLVALAQHAAVYAPADLAALTALWLVALASMVLIFSKASWPYYRQQPADRMPATG